MGEQSYKTEEMVNTLIDLASEEVRKAKQRGYFGKDLAESVCYVMKMVNMSNGEMGRGYERGEYGNRGEYGRGEYGNSYGHDEYEESGEYGARGNRRGERYGRTGQRYG